MTSRRHGLLTSAQPLAKSGDFEPEDQPWNGFIDPLLDESTRASSAAAVLLDLRLRRVLAQGLAPTLRRKRFTMLGVNTSPTVSDYRLARVSIAMSSASDAERYGRTRANLPSVPGPTPAHIASSCQSRQQSSTATEGYVDTLLHYRNWNEPQSKRSWRRKG